ncbi:MAG TPA: adenylate/guanylate cyclase domain-containing protein [Actinomycetota bacterium]|nr:adenylate/guanylate cyclase domain-containing protein [Actinomycetota bacterium]
MNPTNDAGAHEVRKTVSIVFCDVTDSTSLGERLDPEALRQVMSRYFDRMEAVLVAHGGTVEKFIGDAVMAVFGIPLLHEDDALRAVRAAAEMRDALVELNVEVARRWGLELRNRTGVNTGEVVTGTDAGRTLVTGDAVNVAARLEQAAEPGEILLGPETYRLTAHAISAERLDTLALKGRSGAVEAFRLLDVEPGLHRAPMRLDSPMLGRDRPLRLLRDTYEEAVTDRACFLLTVLGPAGIGKSRLAFEFLEGLEEATVLSGRCLPYGDGITFWPVAEMVRGAAGIGEADARERARARIVDLLDGADDREVVAVHLARLMGLAEGPRAEPGWALRRLLETLAGRAPVVAVFDDVHWAEPGLVGAIEQVADLSRDAPILILCLARPELLDDRPSWGAGRTRAASIQLEPLGETDARALLENLVGGRAIDDEIADRIHGTARGNPLFVEQMLSALLETGAVVRRDDRWVAAADLAAVRTPTALSSLLSARLDRLSDDERVVLSRGAVVGEIFERRAIHDLVPATFRASVDEQIGALLRKDLIRPTRSDVGKEQEAFRFRHILIRDAAYDSLPKHERAVLHERFAELLERTSGVSLAEAEEIAAHHLERAYRCRCELGPLDDVARELARRAAARLASAGRRVHDTRWDVVGTVSLLSRAWDLVPPGSGTRLEFGPDLALALVEHGDFDRAVHVSSRVVEEGREAGDLVAEARGRVARWLARANSDPSIDLRRAEAEADEAIAFLEAKADDLGAARAWQLKASVRWVLMDYGGRVSASERAASLAKRARAGWDEAEAMANIVYGLVLGDVPFEECDRRIGRILEAARSGGSRRLEADALACLGHIAADRGERARAHELIAEAAHLYRDVGRETEYWGVRALNLDSISPWWFGQEETAEAVLREGYEALGRLGEVGVRSTVAAFLALVLVDRGELDEALRLADEAEALGGPWDLANLILGGVIRAKVAAVRGDHAEAIAHAERAVTLSDGGDDIRTQAQTRLALAESLAAAGRNDEADAAARDALSRAERKGSVVLAERVRAFLEQIEPRS